MHLRKLLERLLRIFSVVLGIGLVYVLLDFAIDFRPPAVDSSYRFTLPALEFDEPVILRQDNLSLVVIRRSTAILGAIESESSLLQDPDSGSSRQPDDVDRRHRAREAEYFVAYAMGTDFGCPLAVDERVLREVCGSARYDFAGRALRGQRQFPNLTVPAYNFSADRKILTVYP